MHIVRSKDPFLFFSKCEKEQITQAIQEAEKLTSGEIRVHLERCADKDIMVHAKKEFERLGMANTDARNGVLIFIGVKSRRFAILGDRGINEKIPAGFWDEVVHIMVEQFKEDRFADGLSRGIQKIGEKLQEFFPYQRNNTNQLPDEISFSL